MISRQSRLRGLWWGCLHCGDRVPVEICVSGKRNERSKGSSRLPYRTASKLIGLAVMSLIIRRMSIPQHSHDIGKHHSRAIVLVRVEENTQTLKVILVAKHWTLLSAVGSHPHGEAIAEEVSLAIDVELDFDFPVCGGERYARVDPAGLRGSVGGEADVLVGADDGVAAKVPPAALEVRVEVWLD